MPTTDLSIVIPAFNEADRIGRLLEDLASFRVGFPGWLEIILSDDGSSDDTIAVSKRLAADLGLEDSFRVIPHEKNRGKGHAVRTGILQSCGDLVLFCDADGATPMREYYRLQARIDEGFDVAVGSRDLPGANLVVPQPFHRRWMGAAMRFLVWHLVVKGIRDTQCGFKLFRNGAAQAIFSRQTLDGFSFDVEALYLAQKLGYKVAEVPLEWHDQPGSKVDVLRAPPAMLRDLFVIRHRHRQLSRLHGRRSEVIR